MTLAIIPKKEENNHSLKPLDPLASVPKYVAAASAPATRKAYSGDWRQFQIWCSEQCVEALPALPATIANYIADQADAGKKVAPLITANGHPYNESVVVDWLSPRSDLKTELIFQPGRMEELRPGRYTLKLYSGSKVVHTETFEIVP